MARFSYGGQALIEGVLMRGRNSIAVALRHPDGRIVWADEQLAVGFRATRWARLPFVRGLVVLYETLVVGTRWLVRSAGVAAVEELPSMAPPAPAPPAPHTSLAPDTARDPAIMPDGLEADPAPSPVRAPAAPSPAPADSAELGKGALVVGVGLFFFLPLLLAKAIAGSQSGVVERAVEGVIQVVIFLGYLLLIGRTSDVRRTFQYHGAEHMSIHALEAGDPLTVDAVRKYPTAHPRCGTEFLVAVILVSIVVFSLVGRQAIPVMIASRIVLIPVIAGISYELLRFGARHRASRIVRWLFQPGIWVQKITTKQPTDDMLEVAIVSLEQALLADGEVLPDGAGRIGRSPLILSAEASPAPGA
jgi:uncharacterized protein YqhQ